MSWGRKSFVFIAIVCTLQSFTVFGDDDSDGSSSSSSSSPTPNYGGSGSGNGSGSKSQGNCTLSPSDQAQADACVNAGDGTAICSNEISQVTSASAAQAKQFEALNASQAESTSATALQQQQSIATYCKNMAKLDMIQSVLSLAQSSGCDQAAKACESACTYARRLQTSNRSCDTQKNLAKAISSCAKTRGAAMQIQQGVQALANSMQEASQCNNLVTDVNCAVTPWNTACLSQTDCSNPTIAAQDMICICNSNANDRRCLDLANGNNQYGEGDNSNLSSLKPNSSNGTDNSGGFGNDNTVAPPGKASQLQAENIGGGGGGGFGGGGKSGLLPPKGPPGGPAASTFNTKISGGYSNPQGGGGSSAGPTGAGGQKVTLDGNSSLTRGQEKVDLRKFLPQGYADPKARILAGESGPDGITGPYSNIWLKVSTRYQALTYSLKK